VEDKEQQDASSLHNRLAMMDWVSLHSGVFSVDKVPMIAGCSIDLQGTENFLAASENL
jgi:hypothetical protein